MKVYKLMLKIKDRTDEFLCTSYKYVQGNLEMVLESTGRTYVVQLNNITSIEVREINQ